MKNTYKRMPEQIRIDYEDLTETKKVNIYTGGLYMDYKGEPFTGFAVGTDYASGKREVTWEQQYVKGEGIGWSIDYYNNGMIKNESLDIGATNVYFVEYDEEGNSLGDNFFAEDLLEELCEIIGEDPKNAKPLELN
ncbi:hypothetical protein F7018_00265 [Tenacibaculum aiptasiae]|uniref:Uncharacterized protein n=1 Tax=Tenacibaculum aiptasiae TaxID=426481 RepID=A0A7J5ART1_9FLAO|nr:hypothetical protein [Tenacibaculum aiptasiae]KAB1160345.1 hypothetical protein F7018_00265 [Tenacibaculum aiptasiae]